MNLSRRLRASCTAGDPTFLAAALRAGAPAPHAAFIAAVSDGAEESADAVTILGNSPERFLSLSTDARGRDPPDQGDPPPRWGRRRRSRRGRRALGRRQGSRRARHDRRSRAQRSGARLPTRQRGGRLAGAGGVAADGSPPDLDRARAAAPGRRARRAAGRDLSGRLGDRRAQASGDADHRRARAGSPGRLHRRHRLVGCRRAISIWRSRSARRCCAAVSSSCRSAAGSWSTPTPEGELRETEVKARAFAALCDAKADRPPPPPR